MGKRKKSTRNVGGSKKREPLDTGELTREHMHICTPGWNRASLSLTFGHDRQSSNVCFVSMRRPSIARCESASYLPCHSATWPPKAIPLLLYLNSAEGNATLICKICGQSFSCRTDPLTAPIDVYCEWIDATEAVNA